MTLHITTAGLRSMVTRENIGTEIAASDATTSDELNSGPPLSPNKDALAQPVRNSLLAYADAFVFRRRVVPEELSKPVGKLVLPAGNLDSSLKRDNVVSLHKHAKYTNRFVRSTIAFVGPPNKEACTVLDMVRPEKKKPAAPHIRPARKRRERREAVPGADGRTLGERLQLAMAHESGRRGGRYRPADLLTEVNRIANRPDDNPILSQQLLSAILTNKVTRTSVTPFLAAACHVNGVWLGEGIGDMLD
jgi:hypothetical protein